MAQSVAYFTGFETGDTSEVGNSTAGTGISGVGHSVQASVVISGGYSFKIPSGNTALSYFFYLSGSQASGRFKFRQSALQAGGTTRAIFRYASGTLGSPSRQVTLVVTTATNKLGVLDGNSILGTITGSQDGNIVIAANTTYQIEYALDLAAGGIIKVWVDGVLDIDCTHATNASGTAFTQMAIGSTTAGTGDNYYDDIRLDIGGVARVGNGRTIGRQIKSGTPTYNSWTAHGGATVDACWSDTPFDTTNYMDDTGLNAFQTGLTASFSATQSGHGTEIINSGATINAVKVGVVGKSSVTAAGAGAFSIRRRLNGSDTDTSKTFTTSDAYYETAPFTDTLTNLNASEIGAGHGGVAATHTVRDVWMMVEYAGAYTLAMGVGSFTFSGIAALFPVTRKVTASVGAFVLSGIAAALKAAHTMAAAKGTFTLTGVAALFPVTRKVVAAVGAFVLTGIAAAFSYGYKVVAAKGTFTLTGVAAALKAARSFAAAKGTFSLTGVSVSLHLAWLVAASVGAYTVTGVSAVLRSSRTMAAATGSFLLTGKAAAFIQSLSYFLNAATGVFTLSGKSAVLTWLGVLGRIIPRAVVAKAKRHLNNAKLRGSSVVHVLRNTRRET